MITAGSQAPDFTLPDTQRNPVQLSGLRGRSVVLAFFPGAFTNVCKKELCAFRDMLANLEGLNAQVIGISVDSPFANGAFATVNNLGFPLLSDYSREVSHAYGGVHEDFLGLKGYSVSKRAVFVVDPEGMIRYVWVSDDPGLEPPYRDIESALAEI